jgi:hypothetical protein
MYLAEPCQGPDEFRNVVMGPDNLPIFVKALTKRGRDHLILSSRRLVPCTFKSRRSREHGVLGRGGLGNDGLSS